MKKELFGTVQGRDVYLYTLENSRGMKAVISDFGALNFMRRIMRETWRTSPWGMTRWNPIWSTDASSAR